MATLLDSTKRVLQLVQNGWVANHYALDEFGRDCEPWSDRASQWCAIGAIQAVCYYEDGEEANGPKCKLMHTLYDSANAGELLGNLKGTPFRDDPTKKWCGATGLTVEHTNDASSQEHAIRRMARLVNYIEARDLQWGSKQYKVHSIQEGRLSSNYKPFGVK